VIVVIRLGGTSATVEMKWKINVHHVAVTRGCVVRTTNPCPVGAQMAWLV
jgi:hypothetical protein